MTGSTTNLHIPYIDPSQSEPEVPYNAGMDIIDAAVHAGVGAALTVHDGTTSVAAVSDLLLVGAVVTSPSAGHAVATIAGGGGGGGGGGAASGARLKTGVNVSIPNTTGTMVAWDTAAFDTGGYYSGAHPTRLTAPATGLYQVSASIYWAANVTGERTLQFAVNGNTSDTFGIAGLSPPTDGGVVLTVLLSLTAGDYVECFVYQNSGGALNVLTAQDLSTFGMVQIGGSAAAPTFLEPEQHSAAAAFAANDEFERAAGTAIDTAGTRFSGAAPWIWGNQGTSTAIETGDGNLNLLGQADGNYHGVYQAIAHAAPWKYRARVSLQNAAASAGDLASIFAYNSANGHIVGFGPFANTPGMLLIKWTNWTTFSSTAYNTLPRNFTAQALVSPTWYEIRSDGTTLTFAVSSSGAEGSFIDVTSETIATFIGAVTHVGLSISTNSAPPSSLITDLFRQYL